MSEQSNEERGAPQINLGQIVGKNHKYELSVSNETPEDASARRTREMADAELKRKNYSLFCFAIFMVAIIFGSCVYLFMLDRQKIKNGLPVLLVQLHPA